MVWRSDVFLFLISEWIGCNVQILQNTESGFIHKREDTLRRLSHQENEEIPERNPRERRKKRSPSLKRRVEPRRCRRRAVPEWSRKRTTPRLPFSHRALYFFWLSISKMLDFKVVICDKNDLDLSFSSFGAALYLSLQFDLPANPPIPLFDPKKGLLEVC